MKQILRWCLILSFVLAGIAGSFLPVVPGFVFWVAAIGLLASESHVIRFWLRWLRRRFPRQLAWLRIPRGRRTRPRRRLFCRRPSSRARSD